MTTALIAIHSVHIWKMARELVLRRPNAQTFASRNEMIGTSSKPLYRKPSRMEEII